MARSGYDMYFDKCLFPVTPEKISIKINGNNKTVNLINEGEINILKKAGLTDIEFEAEIPQVKHPYAVYKNGFKEGILIDVCCEMADFEYENEDMINCVLQNYSLNGVSMQFGSSWNVLVQNGIAIKRDTYQILCQTGLQSIME